MNEFKAQQYSQITYLFIGFTVKPVYLSIENIKRRENRRDECIDLPVTLEIHALNGWLRLKNIPLSMILNIEKLNIEIYVYIYSNIIIIKSTRQLNFETNFVPSLNIPSSPPLANSFCLICVLTMNATKNRYVYMKKRATIFFVKKCIQKE